MNFKYIIKESPPSLEAILDYSVEDDVKSFKEEVLNCLYETYKNFKIERILLSDGMDSRFLALCLLELGIPIKPLTFIFNDQKNSITKEIELFCKNNGLQHKFFIVDVDPFMKHVEFCTYEKKVAYPVLNGYYHDYLLTEYSNTKFWCGMPNEFRYYDNEYLTTARVSPALVDRNFPNRLFGFDTSRVFFAYINDPIFLKNYNVDRSVLQRDDEYYLRDLIYTNVYPNLSIRTKGSWQDYPIQEKFYPFFNSVIKKEIPWVFDLQSCKFDIHEYFDNKS